MRFLGNQFGVHASPYGNDGNESAEEKKVESVLLNEDGGPQGKLQERKRRRYCR
jgi:hypothetical protein